ncbi:hypothetical protein BO86DRAFT_132897 [Aspergillus japonicus CBS 114.51]|uniref:Uncharacterized protein n=2 Tax=Aspergillus TaxID=5052 RepID=A0A2V5IX34_ASPV1|nr:hypothetical protein BO86DRAFT_132897 [Aspergillus japonicus CBS 114.51]PYI24836.1 hypothetical protein BO99DRAFT_5088 [Aspergillus violaceofuscus CBS 115571]RAH80096.1 hypothetical protein BO86DRAFT_132897 [Aspergillus japonicus CBS 114.51]
MLEERPSVLVIDALITYLAARKTGHRESDDAIGPVEESILALQSLLYGQDDGMEGQRQAEDMLYHGNFSPTSGGRRYFLPYESNGKIFSSTTNHSSLRRWCRSVSGLASLWAGYSWLGPACSKSELS